MVPENDLKSMTVHVHKYFCRRRVRRPKKETCAAICLQKSTFDSFIAESYRYQGRAQTQNLESPQAGGDSNSNKKPEDNSQSSKRHSNEARISAFYKQSRELFFLNEEPEKSGTNRPGVSEPHGNNGSEKHEESNTS